MSPVWFWVAMFIFVAVITFLAWATGPGHDYPSREDRP